MKRKISELTTQEKIETLDALYSAASTLKGRESMKSFLRDLLTESERVMLGRRILIARMLLEGASYIEIGAEMKVGYDTIARVESWLELKAPGFQTAMKELQSRYTTRKKKLLWRDLQNDQSTSGVIARLKKKYPLHFLLFPMPKKYRDL